MRWSFVRKPSDADLAEELEAHLAIETKQLMDGGLPREQAELQARRQLGSRALTMENTRAALGSAWFDRFWQDLRYAVRVLRRSPAFSSAAILSLALGIGATTAVFSIADTIFLRPLPYPDADRLTWVSIQFPRMGGEFVPSPDYVAWRRDNQAFQQLGATQATPSTEMVLGGDNPAEVRAARVSANFLDVFGVTPAAGRNFNAQEELPNGPTAVLLTNEFWRDHFSSRRDVVGSRVLLDGWPGTIIGILPASFVYPADVRVDLITTLPVSPTASHGDRTMSTWAVFGRLRPGVSVSQARADVERLFAASKADSPQMFRADNRVVLQPLREHRAGNVRTLLFILIGAAGCLLAIACANVANLLLARWSARAPELAVRAAIGAGNRRLARQLFTEIALLIGAGTLAAMCFVALTLRAFVRLGAGSFPRFAEVTADFRVFGIALAIAVLTAVVFGALPVMRAGRIDPQAVLQQASRGVSGGHRFVRRFLVATEVALCVILLSGAALLSETLWHLQNDRLGFQPEHLLSISVPVRGSDREPARREFLASSILEDLRRIPGAQVARTECTPLSGGVMSVTFSRSDRPLPEPFHRGDGIALCGVGPGYFQAAGSRLVQGRYLSDEDYRRPGSVAMLNEAAVRAYFPGENPIGRQILGGRAFGWITVAGVIADTKNQGLNRPASPQAFLSDPNFGGANELRFLVRSTASDGVVARELREQLKAARLSLFVKVETLNQRISEVTATPRFQTVLLASFAAIAWIMAIVGVFGVLAFSVAQRRGEIGIRMAMGASPEAVVALVLKEGAWLVSAGALAGLGGALFLTRYLTSLLYGVSANDPLTYAAVIAALGIAAVAASFLPARKAARVDPAITLRNQ